MNLNINIKNSNWRSPSVINRNYNRNVNGPYSSIEREVESQENTLENKYNIVLLDASNIARTDCNPNREELIQKGILKDNQNSIDKEENDQNAPKITHISNDSKNTLVLSSPRTLNWINKIKNKIEKQKVELMYKKSKHWASFKNPKTGRIIAFLNPQKNQIRVFLKLDPSADNSLQYTPSSGAWAKNFPSVFKVNNESLIDKAVNFIIASYHQDSNNC
ncbi:MAG: hypothetical protein ACTSRL_21020 [Candidatus Helarchaeota archaeon]